MFEKVLIANRGEIAIRVIRTLEELGIASVAVYSELDRDALHVARADEAYPLGGQTAAESYLNTDTILDVVPRAAPRRASRLRLLLRERRLRAGVRGRRRHVHRPAPEAIEVMGDKTRARELMRDAGVQIVPGTTEPVRGATRRATSSATSSATRSPSRRAAAAGAARGSA